MTTTMIAAAKKEPIFSFDQEVKIEGQEKSNIYRIELKKPTRTQYADADMFYSIQVNKYIKMGLLTAEQLAKRQIDVGGTFSEDQQKHYISLQTLMAEKQEIFLKLMGKGDDLTEDEKERKTNIYRDIAMIKSQLSDYEYIKNQAYEHTANSKARNDVILWWILNITQLAEIKEDSKIEEFRLMFPGENYETKKLQLDEMEDNDDPIIKLVFAKLAKIITLWYWMGISDKEKLKEFSSDQE